MTWRRALRVAAGIGIGLGLASLPFVHYGASSHRHPSPAAHAASHAH